MRISIHAPREGGDISAVPCHATQGNFNPRPPRGGRPWISSEAYCMGFIFQSTPPARGATGRKAILRGRQYISIHAPREGGDRRSSVECFAVDNFNPRPPRGGRPYKPRSERTKREFQSTPPARGATSSSGGSDGGSGDFNPRPPRGGRLNSLFPSISPSKFQSTPPARGATK